MTLRILHVGKYFPPQRGGMETYLADLIAAQRAQGIDASALVHGDPLPDDPDWLVRVPVEFHLSYAPMALGFRSALARAIKRFEPDVLHLHMPNNSAFWALTVPAARALPWVVHWHSDVVVSKIKTTIAAAYWLYRPLELSLLTRSERIIVTSPPYLEASEPLAFWRYKCSVVPMGLKITEPPPAPAPLALPWRDGSFRLLSIGRLAYYKGFATLIRAVAALPGVELVIAGGGPQRAELQAQIDSLTPQGEPARIRLLGEVSEHEKHALLRACDLFCLASRERTEAFGLVLFEAMHHARPCLVSDLPGSGMPWVVREAGAGWLAPVDDVDGWRRAIDLCRAAPDERSRRGEAGRRALDARFTLAASTAAITSLYATQTDESPLRRPANDALVVIPARHASATISRAVRSLHEVDRVDVLVVDDHSGDGTAELARAAGARVLRPLFQMTPWVALQAGLRFGLAHGYRWVITLPADEQDLAPIARQLLAAPPQADLVVGHRPVPRARRGSDFDPGTDSPGLRRYSPAALRVLASPQASLLDYQDPGSLLLLRAAGIYAVDVDLSEKPAPLPSHPFRHSAYERGRHLLLTGLLRLAYALRLRIDLGG